MFKFFRNLNSYREYSVGKFQISSTKEFISIGKFCSMNFFLMVIISPDRYILYYLTKPIPNEYMYSFRNIKKYHVSFHQSRFEQEIFHNIQNSRRFCKLCSPSEIEDDFHFILICPFYEKKKILFSKIKPICL